MLSNEEEKLVLLMKQHRKLWKTKVSGCFGDYLFCYFFVLSDTLLCFDAFVAFITCLP